jgi:hypothetical protein
MGAGMATLSATVQSSQITSSRSYNFALSCRQVALTGCTSLSVNISAVGG